MRIAELWLAILLGLYVRATVARLLGAPSPAPRDGAGPGGVPIERAGQGLSCAPAETGLPPFSRCCVGPEGARRCGEMSFVRRRMLGGAIPLDRASRADLEALPGIGPRLAERILEAHARDPKLGTADLARIRGIGARRAPSLGRMLGLDAEGVHDLCSSGSWPTTSSGCGKPP